MAPPSRGGAPEVAVQGDAEKGFDALERALPHCEVLLHGSSRL